MPSGAIYDIDTATLGQECLDAVDELHALIHSRQIKLKNRNGEDEENVKRWANIEFNQRKHIIRIQASIRDIVVRRYVWFSTATITHNRIGIFNPQKALLKAIILNVDIADDTNTYAAKLYADPTGTLADGPFYLTNMVNLYPTYRQGFTAVLDYELTPGEYGVQLERISGSGESAFSNAVLDIFAEPLFF